MTLAHAMKHNPELDTLGSLGSRSHAAKPNSAAGDVSNKNRAQKMPLKNVSAAQVSDQSNPSKASSSLSDLAKPPGFCK